MLIQVCDNCKARIEGEHHTFVLSEHWWELWKTRQWKSRRTKIELCESCYVAFRAVVNQFIAAKGE